MKKLIQYVVLLIALLSILSCQEISAGKGSSDDGNTTDPDNSPTDPIYISTVEGLFSITDNLAGNYILTTDISLSGYEWTPIGSKDEPFSGTFDGDGYTISDLNIEVSAGAVAFFAYLEEESEVSNLTIKGNIKTEDGNAALFAISNYGKITNCHTEGSVSGIYASGFVRYNKGIICDSGSDVTIIGSRVTGGFVGTHYGGEIRDCYSNCTISTTLNDDYTDDIGGFVGLCSGIINACYSTGKIYNNGASRALGGFIGEITGYQIVIDNCYSNVEIIGETGAYIGGFVGENVSSTVSNCYSTGTVSIDDGHYIGGFIGYNNKPFSMLSPEATIENCYCTGNATGKACIGGFAGKNKNGIFINCYSEGSIQGDYLLGGFVADNGGGEFNSCHSSGSVSATTPDEDSYFSRNYGGFVGRVDSGSFFDCYSMGNVTVLADGSENPLDIGGFVGGSESLVECRFLSCRCSGDIFVRDNAQNVGGFAGRFNAIADSCYSTGNVKCGINSIIIGGFAGYCYTIDLSRCFTIGTIEVGNYANKVGGFIGSYFGRTSLSTNYSASIIVSSGFEENSGGFIGYNNIDNYDEPIVGAYFIDSNYDNSIGLLKTDGWNDPETFDEAYWDFDTDWEIDENGIKNNGYPYLKSVPLFM